MNSFRINIGNESRSLRVEQELKKNSGTNKGNSYKLFIDGEDNSWADEENVDMENVPVDTFLGTITIKNAKDFTFDGKGILSGEDLLFITNQITKHPSFTQPDEV